MTHTPPPPPRSIQRRRLWVSLADGACLALGLQRRATVLTADAKWKLVKVSVKVKLIRNAN
jgi:PIN domain nuclease of toxin-antitoxin system